MGTGGMATGGMGTGGMGTGGMGTGGMGTGGMGTGGAGGGGMMAKSGNFFFFGDYVTNSTDEVALYDTTAKMIMPLTLDKLDGTDINAMALSSDGKTLAVAGHDTNAGSDFLYAYDVSNPSTPGAAVTLVDTSNAGFSVEIIRIQFSPDGLQVAFIGDVELNAENNVYVVPVDGSQAAKRVSPKPPTSGDAKTILWADNKTVVFTGDVVTNDVDGLWSVDVTAMQPSPVELVPYSELASGADVVTAYPHMDAAGLVYFKSNYKDSTYRLYRVQVNGMGLEQVPGTAIMDGGELEIGGWGLSPDGKRLAFGTAQVADKNGQVYVVDVSQVATASAVTNFTGAPNAGKVAGISFGRIRWSPDQTLLTFTGDWKLAMDDVDNENSIYVAPVADTTAVRIARPASQDANFDAYSGRFSNDGMWLIIHGDMVSANEDDVFVTGDFTTADQMPANIQVVASPNNGDVKGVALAP
jgi:WD40 repeat protein